MKRGWIRQAKDIVAYSYVHRRLTGSRCGCTSSDEIANKTANAFFSYSLYLLQWLSDKNNYNQFMSDLLTTHAGTHETGGAARGAHATEDSREYIGQTYCGRRQAPAPRHRSDRLFSSIILWDRGPAETLAQVIANTTRVASSHLAILAASRSRVIIEEALERRRLHTNVPSFLDESIAGTKPSRRAPATRRAECDLLARRRRIPTSKSSKP